MPAKTNNFEVYLRFISFIWSAFHSTKTLKNLKTAANGTENSRKSFQKFRKLLNFRNANHSTENSRNFGSKVEWKENFREKKFENLGIPREVAPFSANFKFRKWFWLNKKRPCFHSIVRSVIGWKIRVIFLNQLKLRLKPSVTWSHHFSRA